MANKRTHNRQSHGLIIEAASSSELWYKCASKKDSINVNSEHIVTKSQYSLGVIEVNYQGRSDNDH